MFKLPKWVADTFDQSSCPFAECKKKLESQGVAAVGIREELEPGTKKLILSFFYEYKCPHCSNRSVFTGFPTSLEDFIGDMIEIANLPTDKLVNESQPKSKISPSEIKEARRFIRKVKDFKDFMKFFGIDDLEIDDGNEPKNQ
jgi:hypothetical protein